MKLYNVFVFVYIVIECQMMCVDLLLMKKMAYGTAILCAVFDSDTKEKNVGRNTFQFHHICQENLCPFKCIEWNGNSLEEKSGEKTKK